MTDGAQSNRKIGSYADFWPYYLQEHARPLTRALHYCGTSLAILSVLGLALTGNAWFIAGALLGGYGFAWAGHLFVEKNRPATFTYPLWSLASDFRMAWAWATGTLPDELARAGVE
jgi:hypothetical protein